MVKFIPAVAALATFLFPSAVAASHPSQHLALIVPRPPQAEALALIVPRPPQAEALALIVPRPPQADVLA